MQITLNFDEELLINYASRGSSLLFGIAWEHNGSYYPDKKWLDFGGVIIGWWIMVVNQLLREDITTGKFMFMDGPYSIDIQYDKDFDIVKLKPNGLNVTWETSLQELKEEIILAADKTVEEFLRLNIDEEHWNGLQKGKAMLNR